MVQKEILGGDEYGYGLDDGDDFMDVHLSQAH